VTQGDDITPYKGNILEDVFCFLAKKMFFRMTNILGDYP